MTDPSICASCAYWPGNGGDCVDATGPTYYCSTWTSPDDADWSATCPAWVCATLPDLDPDDDTPEGCHGVRCDDCDDPNCPSNPENGAGMP